MNVQNIVLVWMFFLCVALGEEKKPFGDNPFGDFSEVKKKMNKKPNFIFITLDGLGYNDLSCYGAKSIHTPVIDKLAQEGRRYTDYMNVASFSSGSRAAMLTGCYPKRIGMANGELKPQDNYGLNPDEVTIADYMQYADYFTSYLGSWQLGHSEEVLPMENGFDYFFGLPHLNNMNHPSYNGVTIKMTEANQKTLWAEKESTLTKWYVPLMENNRIKELPVDQRTLATRYTNKAIERIDLALSQKYPFFIYLAHTTTNAPIYVPDELWHEDYYNSYKTAVEHIDTEIGRLVTKLKSLGIENNTYIFVTAHNGPMLEQQGSSHPLKGKKYSNFEGGHRAPLIVWAPTNVPAGTKYKNLVRNIDLLPTLLSLAFVPLDRTNEIDGIDAYKSLSKDSELIKQTLIYYNTDGEAVGIREASMKYFKEVKAPDGTVTPAKLYDLSTDIKESKNVLDKHPAQAMKLAEWLQILDQDISKNIRPSWKKK